MVSRREISPSTAAVNSLVGKKLAIADAAIAVARGTMPLSIATYKKEKSHVVRTLPVDIDKECSSKVIEREVFKSVSQSSSVSLPARRKCSAMGREIQPSSLGSRVSFPRLKSMGELLGM